MDSTRQGVSTSKVKRIQLQPDYCPLHDVFGPCIHCLAPEVVRIIVSNSVRTNNKFFFQSIDRNLN